MQTRLLSAFRLFQIVKEDGSTLLVYVYTVSVYVYICTYIHTYACVWRVGYGSKSATNVHFKNIY